MHCKACVFLIQDTVSELEGVGEVKVSLKRQTVEMVCHGDEMTPEMLSTIMNPLLQPHGYSVHTSPPARKSINWGEYLLAFLMAAVLIF